MKFAYYDDDVLKRQISGERFTVSYRFRGDEQDCLLRAKTVCVEQTVEFPAEHIECDTIQNDILGRIEEFVKAGEDCYRAVISYPIENVGEDFPQFLNTLFGNSCILPDITVEDVTLPESMKDVVKGPKYGLEGLRDKLSVKERPFCFTALKPLGLPPEALAELAYRCALGGIDLIKDDHGILDQSFAEFKKRVRLVSKAVEKANSETGGHTAYIPNASGSFAGMLDRISAVEEYGAAGIMFAPGLVGFDMLNYAARHTSLIVVGHPAFLGSYMDRGKGGIDCECLIGLLPRLAGADIMVYPNFGGRFSYSEEQCHGIQEMAIAERGWLKKTVPSPAGGMTVQRIDEMKRFYGNEVSLLIGGSLFTSPGGLTENCRKFRDKLEEK
ncbi:MAG: ribulose 1,5-bisphosphate carboxylase large subunit [Lachnospiraceae bacterium]|nr:ribulose 1,5-bisphosphate carboxylase large subunit [Lachnospiraceae bacterium]